MPGLAIILSDPGRPELIASLARMLAPLTYPGHTSAQLVVPEFGVAVGQTGPSLVARPQPGYARAGQIAALLDGEPLDISGLGEGLGLPPTASPAEVIAGCYAAQGEISLEAMRGHWAVALVDRSQGRVVVANDAFGLRPLYRLRAGDGAWLIASHPAALLAYPGIPREVEPAGLADFLAFGHPLGEHTLFRGVERLPAATLMSWAAGELRLRRYWAPAMRPLQRWSQADLEAIRGTFNETVASMVAAGGPLSLALSGGGDSRAILSTMVAAGLRPDTVTHAVAEASDIVLSKQLAAQAGTTHHSYVVRGEDLASYVEPAVRLFGGQVAGVDVHPLCFLNEYPAFTRAMFTGLGGNLYKRSHFFVEQNLRLNTLPALARWVLGRYNQLIYVQGDFEALLTPEWYPALRDLPGRSVNAALESIGPETPMAQRSFVFYLQERVCKYLSKGDALVRREIETRHPFMDRRLLELVCGLPAAARNRGVVPMYIITRNAPQLLDVPTTWELGDGFPPRRYPLTTWERVTTYVSQVRQMAAEQRRGKSLMVHNYRYADWLRGGLRPLVEDVLLDPRAQARPFFRPETVRRWVDEHMAGQNRALKLGALLSLELTLRAFVDRAPVG